MGENFLSVILYSFHIFEGNYIELRKAIDGYVEAASSNRFASDGEKTMNLHLNGRREISRCLHNYVAAWKSLVDHSTTVKQKLEKQLGDVKEFAEEYNACLNTWCGSFENVFVQGLRNYSLHKKIPVPTLHYKLTRIDNIDIASDLENVLCQESFSLELNSRDLEDFNGWKPLAKEYIKKNRSIPISEIIDKHFGMMKDFYLWIEFRDNQLHPHASIEVKKATFETWKQNGRSLIS